MDLNKFTEKSQKALTEAQAIGTRHQHQADIGKIFKTFDLRREKFLQPLTEIRGNHRVTSANPEATYEALEKYGRDLTRLAAQNKLYPVIGRDAEIRRCIQVLSRRTKNNPVMIGEPGVGKTAIVEGLARRIVSGDLQLKLLRVRLSERHLDLELTEAAKEYIARQGYDPVYGARPLKRFLQRHLETVLSRQILAGAIPENSLVTVNFKKGQLTFESVPLSKDEGVQGER